MRNLIIVLFILLLALPVQAQEVTPEPTADPPVLVVTDRTNTLDVVGVVVIVVVVAFGTGVLGFRLATAKNEAERLAAIAEARANRPYMEQLEARHAALDERWQKAFDVTLDVLEIVRDVIPGKLDDALVEFGRDIQIVGEEPKP